MKPTILISILSGPASCEARQLDQSSLVSAELAHKQQQPSTRNVLAIKAAGNKGDNSFWLCTYLRLLESFARSGLQLSAVDALSKHPFANWKV